MAVVAVEVYAKYWPPAAIADLLNAVNARLTALGISATVSAAQETSPTRTVLTLSGAGVPANLALRHEDIVDAINARLAIGLRY